MVGLNFYIGTRVYFLNTRVNIYSRFMDQYGELEEGALDGEEIEGALEEAGGRMEQLIQEAQEERRTRRQNIEREKEAARRLATLMVGSSPKS